VGVSLATDQIVGAKCIDGVYYSEEDGPDNDTAPSWVVECFEWFPVEDLKPKAPTIDIKSLGTSVISYHGQSMEVPNDVIIIWADSIRERIK
jgi:hypothetical protein